MELSFLSPFCFAGIIDVSEYEQLRKKMTLSRSANRHEINFRFRGSFRDWTQTVCVWVCVCVTVCVRERESVCERKRKCVWERKRESEVEREDFNSFLVLMDSTFILVRKKKNRESFNFYFILVGFFFFSHSKYSWIPFSGNFFEFFNFFLELIRNISFQQMKTFKVKSLISKISTQLIQMIRHSKPL